MPKDGENHAFIACISVDSVMKMDKKNYAQVYLQECKYKIRKKKMFDFIDVELELNSVSNDFDASDSK